MEAFVFNDTIRWADLDPNFHVLHSKYYDFGASCRMAFLVQHGITAQRMLEEKVGPVLLKESCSFRKELKFGDKISVTLKISKSNPDYSRCSMVHEILKSENIISATIEADIAWIDTDKRKLVVPPFNLIEIFDKLPRTENFQLTSK